jgi:hypothetical protein
MTPNNTGAAEAVAEAKPALEAAAKLESVLGEGRESKRRSLTLGLVNGRIAHPETRASHRPLPAVICLFMFLG